MLKVLPACNVHHQTNTKCGEIYFHSFTDFTIYCCFCNIKLFAFKDFLLHVQKNVHFENNLLKNETLTEGCNEFIKEEFTDDANDERDFKEEETIKSVELQYAKDDSSEEETIMVIKVKKAKCKTHLPQENSNMLKNDSLKDSKQKHKVLEYSCTECSEIFCQKKDLTQHMVRLHNGYKCPLCDKRFGRSTHVMQHLKTHTNKKSYVCPMQNCGRGFIMEEYLTRHLEMHTMERTFKCDYENCGKAFQSHRRLVSHKFSHLKKFVCDMCGHGFRSSADLITHQRVHTGEKPFPCEVCRKPFISKAALSEHMISHLETRPHVCLICNADFANRRILVRHSFIHTDEKTFKCKLCGRAFKHPNSLQGHIRNIHREPKLKKAEKH